ncbi:MAG: CRISPR-associated helicase/endonuclease Cas3 [Syntrophus sp. (in: bacteria)]|nr:CRISPR-associated helicase/endonuclease Cas3 [Syntrophus sp. (in: bacteria)]
MGEYYAHSLPGRPKEEWQQLEEHLKNVAGVAKGFAEDFGAGEWGYLAGLWHDLGKYSQEFQARLQNLSDPDAHIEAKPGRPDHSTAGAQHAYNMLKDKGKMIAYAIAGHHAGLPDGKTPDQSCLVQRFKKDVPNYSDHPPSILNQKASPELPFSVERQRFCFQFTFFVRMLFSCLTDADFLDTERFMEANKSLWREGYPDLKLLKETLLKHMDEVVAHAPPSVVNGQRAEIYHYCLDAANLKPGLFSLTVPTGGGKTLSSLSFALKHAVINNLKRVIYVIPYTSIIEQNADVFRQILGEDAVLEHHSNYDPSEEDHRSRLASENWDAPLIVTTNVQFFESLFSSRSSRCRRLHNIARSVIILDEAQMLPAPLLKPCLEAMKELALSYGSTIVLCTATQPALSKSAEFRDGLENVREIIPDPIKLYKIFRKVDVSSLGTLTNEELGRQLIGHEQVLCIVNTRRHARQVYEQISDNEGCYHLSALMCPAHRTETISEIKKTLKDKKSCRVISTQLIEAGVDIDFPVVFRSLSGIDSIVQAAGRCNREGKMRQNGAVYVFMPEDGLPPGYFRQTADTAEEVMRHHNDPITLEAVEEYFRTLYWLKNEKLDEYGILTDISEGSLRGDFPFRQISKKFKMIKEIGQESLIIPWNADAQKIINELRYSDYPASAARKAQRFTIQIPSRTFYNLLGGGAVERLHEQYNVLTNRDIYRMNLGLCPEDPAFHEIENLIL